MTETINRWPVSASAENQKPYEGHYSKDNTAATLDAHLLRRAEDRHSISLSTNVPMKTNQVAREGSKAKEQR